MTVDAARNLLIVGGGPGGLAVARAYRDAGGDGKVTMITPERDAPYMRPSLSKAFLRGETEAGEIALEDDGWFAENDVDLRRGTAAEAIDTGSRTVTVNGGEALEYDALVLALGSEPVRIPVPGADDPSVCTLRSLEDARNLRSDVEGAHSAVVVGSGFIGCEAAASLAMRGLRVTLVSDEHVPHATRLGEEAGRRISSWLAEYGVALKLGAPVESIEPGVVRVPGNDPARGDLVLLATGVRPRTRLAEAAGLEMEQGHVVADEHMRTSAEGVYAVGDIARARNAAAGRPLKIEHWVDALAHGKVAGTMAAGQEAAWDSVPAFFSTIGERTLKYVAWGDGFDEARLIDHEGGAFTVWYGSQGITVGALSHDHDEDYEGGRERVKQGRPLP